MKKWYGCQCGDTFLKGSSLEVKFLEQPQSLGQETCRPENSNLNKLVYCMFILSSIPYLASNNHVLGHIITSSACWPTRAWHVAGGGDGHLDKPVQHGRELWHNPRTTKGAAVHGSPLAGWHFGGRSHPWGGTKHTHTHIHTNYLLTYLS